MCGVKRQTTWHLRHAVTNLPVNEDTSSFAFRVVGKTNFAVPRSPAATLIVIYDRDYFSCTPRNTPSICLSIYGSYEIANGPTDTPPQNRGFVPCHRHFSHDRVKTRIHTTNTMIYCWFTITENAVVMRNAFKTHRVFSRWCLWQTASPRYQSPFCAVHDKTVTQVAVIALYVFILDLLLLELLIISFVDRM